MSLLEIRKKIHGVKNTRKITKAMQLVAASKLRQFQKRALSSRSYVRDLLEILENNIDETSVNLYTEQRKEGPTLFVIYTSDKGLCGALNSKLLKALFQSEEWTSLNSNQRLLVTIGRKSKEFAQNNGIEVAKDFSGIPEKLANIDVIKVVDSILEFWRKNLCKEIIFVSPHYKNSFTFYPIRKQFLPFSKDMLKDHLGGSEKGSEVDKEVTEVMKAKTDFMLYSPNKGQVIERLYEQIVQALFVQAFTELKAAEYSSRMIAMKNATDAATKLTDELTLKFNKARQQAITSEIAELVGAMAAVGS